MNAKYFTKSSAMSITIDGSKDFMGDEFENVYARIVASGVVKEVFLKIGSPKSTCAYTIQACVM